MSSELTIKERELLGHVAKSGSVQGVYALAKTLNRPYKRVLDDVRRLESAGLLKITPTIHNGRRLAVIEAGPHAAQRQPELTYSRVWSSPATGVSDRVLIASVLETPTFADVLSCCRHYGVNRVRSIYSAMVATDEIDGLTQMSLMRMLANIEIGFARAA